jgi:hypothetical protein
MTRRGAIRIAHLLEVRQRLRPGARGSTALAAFESRMGLQGPLDSVDFGLDKRFIRAANAGNERRVAHRWHTEEVGPND